MSVHALLTSIPDVIWSGVIASLLTLGGVLLANRSNTTRLRIQLEHESIEKAKQRRAELRKDVYLAVAEELVKANGYLGTFPNTDLSKTDAFTPVHGFFSAAAKLQIVADTRTALLASQLVGTYGQLLFKVMRLTKPIQDANFSAQLAKQYLDQAQTDIKRILALITSLNESGEPNSEHFAALGRSFEFQQAQAEKYAAEQQAALDRAASFQLAFLREFLPEIKKIGLESIALMIEIRREFDIESDGVAIGNELRTQWQRMDESVTLLLHSLNEA